MSTIDNTVGGNGAFPAVAAPSMYKLKQSVNFGTTSRASGDVIQMIKIPAEAVVQQVKYEVDVSDATLNDFSVGDGSNVSRYHSSKDATSVGNAMSALTSTNYYSAADTLDILLAANASGGKITITASMVDFTG